MTPENTKANRCPRWLIEAPPVGLYCDRPEANQSPYRLCRIPQEGSDCPVLPSQTGNAIGRIHDPLYPVFVSA